MDELALWRFIRDSGVTADKVLRLTKTERLDQVVAALKRYRPEDEVCDALIDRIAEAPQREFESLREIFLRHFR